MRKIRTQHLNKLAKQAKALATRPLFIDWSDKTVRAGVVGGQVTQEIQFGTVLEACEYVEQRAESAAVVIGFGYISHIASLPVDGYEPGEYDPDWSVVVSLNVWNKQDDLVSVVMETWARNYKIMQEARKFREEWSKKHVITNDTEPISTKEKREESGPKPELTPEQERERLRRVWNSGGVHLID